MDTEFVLGAQRLVIKSDMITVAKARELRAAIKEVGVKHDAKLEEQKKALREIDKEYSSRLIKLEDESMAEYEERITPILEEKQAAVDGVLPEDNESYVMKLAFDCLSVLGHQFGQAAKVTQEGFDAGVWDKTKLALAKLLINNECELGVLFLPPRSLN
jgi:hypothetical protein